jgi:hypothetical protein
VFWSSVIAASTIGPLLAIIGRKVRRGAWSDFDVSRHEQRSGLYYAGLPLLALSGAILYFLDADPGLLRAVAAAIVMFTVALAGNRFLKTSMHMMVATFCAVSLVREYPAAALAVVPFVAAIAWSRRHLERHTWAEIAVGIALGAAFGAAAG